MRGHQRIKETKLTELARHQEIRPIANKCISPRVQRKKIVFGTTMNAGADAEKSRRAGPEC